MKKSQLLKEDHYQMLKTLELICLKSPFLVTENTRFMISKMRETETIVDALHRIINEKIALNSLLIRKIQEDRCYSSNYSARLIKILT